MGNFLFNKKTGFLSTFALELIKGEDKKTFKEVEPLKLVKSDDNEQLEIEKVLKIDSLILEMDQEDKKAA